MRCQHQRHYRSGEHITIESMSTQVGFRGYQRAPVLGLPRKLVGPSRLRQQLPFDPLHRGAQLGRQQYRVRTATAAGSTSSSPLGKQVDFRRDGELPLAPVNPLLPYILTRKCITGRVGSRRKGRLLVTGSGWCAVSTPKPLDT